MSEKRAERLVLSYRISGDLLRIREQMLDRARHDLPTGSADEICARADAYHRHVLGMDDPYVVRHWRDAEAAVVSGGADLSPDALTHAIVGEGTDG